IDVRDEYDEPKDGAIQWTSSYFDGSASMKELLANAIFKDAVANDPAYDNAYSPRGLLAKYHRGPLVNNMDLTINARMDELGLWVPTPFPAEEVEKKHREPFSEP